ncbi:Gfo/Idh/MocA family oxidoreductase [Diaphorobacter sp. HDW4A]|uniref:Gfo/Idh/MocA family protein n=1 Tax=Diaphorobacter sp. HDW4A TaxID=2714924 RepID=UPI001407CDBE|nr:Gfo/Idh/MocA family oxidoreductase [Diaphorobacter sp. HDW4A]QIL81310.1 Gfo/Idh/MocA family oxidoreductase [Diaphorobacter sp. HDW4A]
MQHKTRIAIIGYGRFGRVHAMRARTHPAFDVVCVVDPQPHARHAAQIAGFMTVARLQDLPRGVEAAAVVTPYETHAEIAVTLMRMGIDVLVEKPLASTERDIDALLDAECATRRKLCTGHIERFNRLLSAPLWSGTPHSIAFTRCSSLSVGAGSVVLDLMVHDLDTASLLFGRKEEETFEIIGVQRQCGTVNAQVLFCGSQLNLSASHGAHKSNVHLLWQDFESRNELCLRSSDTATGIDALSLQYTAFHELLSGAHSERPIASASEGAMAARRAIAIESWS